MAKAKKVEEKQEENIEQFLDLENPIELGTVTFPADPSPVHYEEWEVKIPKNGEYEKLKCVRKCVKIEDEHAEILNEGVLWGGNTYAKMYFKPE
jgi:hypothetical protein